MLRVISKWLSISASVLASIGCIRVSDVAQLPSTSEAQYSVTENTFPRVPGDQATSPSNLDAPQKSMLPTSTADSTRPAIEPAPIEPITPHEFEVVGPEDAVRVTFADLDLMRLVPDAKSEKDAAEKVPQWIMALNGRRIRVPCAMLPTFQSEGLTAFTIQRDLNAMGFGPNPRISAIIEVQLREGVTTDYIDNRLFDVVGVLKIGADVSPGRFYQLSDAIVIDDRKRRSSRPN